MEEKKLLESKKYNIGYFVLSFLLVFIISFVVLFVIEKEIRSSKFDELKVDEIRMIELENDFLGKEFSMILADLHYLHHDFEAQLDTSLDYNAIAVNWDNFSTQRNIYDQIRYLDISGDEKIRVNLDSNGAYVVVEEDLQNKSDRYYFYEALVLEKEAVHVSPIDLNIERGKIETPYKPIIRFSTPVYCQKNNLHGVIVLNYLAENLLDNFKSLSMSSRGQIALLNSESYWLSSDSEDLEWSFMFDDQENNNFKNIYPEEWDAITQGDGQILTPNGLFTFAQVDLHHKIRRNKEVDDQSLHLKDDNWYIVSSVLRDGSNKSLFVDDTPALVLDVVKKNALYFLLVFFVSVIVALLIYINRKTYSRIKYYSEFDSLTQVYNRRTGLFKL